MILEPGQAKALKELLSGWRNYAWKGDEYIDDIQEHIDKELDKIFVGKYEWMWR